MNTRTFESKDGPFEVSAARAQAYDALGEALGRMVRAAAAKRKPRKFRSGRPCGPGIDYDWTPEMAEVRDARQMVLDGRITAEEAMAVLHTYDVLKARTEVK